MLKEVIVEGEDVFVLFDFKNGGEPGAFPEAA